MPEPADETLILRLIASGLVQAHQVVAERHALRLPYPPPLQRGLDLFTLHCLRAGTTPPAGVPELIRWCHEPLGSWPTPLGGPEVAGDVLLHLGVPTRSCHEWAVPATDVEGELFENDVIAEVRRACRFAGRPEAYVAFRHLVIDKPVLTDREFRNEVDKPKLALLRDPIQRCYPFAPAECVVDGMVWCCADYGNLLVQSPQGPECVDDRCPRTQRARPGRVLPVTENVR